MRAFVYGVCLQWRLDLRSRTMLISCYLVPLLFFAVMGEIFSAVMPAARMTLTQSMTVFGVTMGALIGLPPSLVEIYGSNIHKVYRANGVPRALGAALTGLSAFVHLAILSAVITIAAPLAFDAAPPARPGQYAAGLAVLLAATLSVASVVGLAVRDPAKTTMISILLFLPSILLSGILFPAELLPGVLRAVGALFPATWGFRLLTADTDVFSMLWPLLVTLGVGAAACWMLLRARKE